MAVNEMTLKDIQSILEIIKSADDIQDFSLKFGGAEIHISRGGQAGAEPTRSVSSTSSPVSLSVPTPAAPKVAAGPKAVTKDYGPNATLIKSSMVGVFYRAPAPGEPPFVELGQKVKADQVVCILEVMKLMNSIASPVEGTVTRILVENAEPVEFGQVLMVIEGAS